MEVNLIVANGKQMGKNISISASNFLIGRGEECNLRPQSSLVSRKHCVILVEKDSAAIEDLGSTNGTLVNGEKLTERRGLKNGDRIKVGMLELEVQVAVAADKKKADAHTIQQAAARTVAAAGVSDEDFDVSRWLGEDDETTITPARKEPSVGDDTMSGKSLVDTTAIPVPPPHQEPPQKNEEEKQKKLPPQPATKTVGKILRPPKPMAENSGAAADDALRRHFLHKKSS